MLKKYASILRGIGIAMAVLAVIGGIVIAVKLESFWYFLYCAIGAGLTCFFAVAFAELMDTVADNNECLRKLTRNAGNTGSAAPQESAAPRSSANPVPRSSTNPAPSAGKKRKSPYADPNNACILICPNCKTRQSSENTVCFHCRTPLYEVPAATETESSEKSEPSTANYTVDPDNPDSIICGNCGKSQRSNRNVCFECGAKFEK